MAEKKSEMTDSDALNELTRVANWLRPTEKLREAMERAAGAAGRNADMDRQLKEAESRKAGIEDEILGLQKAVESARLIVAHEKESLDKELETAKSNHARELKAAEDEHAHKMEVLADTSRARVVADQKEKRDLADEKRRRVALFEADMLEMESKKEALITEISTLEGYRSELKERIQSL